MWMWQVRWKGIYGGELMVYKSTYGGGDGIKRYIIWRGIYSHGGKEKSVLDAMSRPLYIAAEEQQLACEPIRKYYVMVIPVKFVRKDCLVLTQEIKMADVSRQKTGELFSVYKICNRRWFYSYYSNNVYSYKHLFKKVQFLDHSKI